MENKKGFISTALVYSFLVIYLFLMLSIINMYLSKTTYLEALDQQVAADIGITKETRKTLFNLLLENNVALETNLIEFGKVSNGTIKNGNGLFYVDESNLAQNEAKVTDENHDGFGKKIFFFRGDVKNNYVVFGKVFKRKADNVIDGSSVKEICWRILRTNENGSVRLIYSGVYDGTGCNSTDLTINNYVTKTVYNENADDNAYVGYTYHDIAQTSYDETHHGSDTGLNLFEQRDSTIKATIDNFFLKNTNFYYFPDYSYVPDNSSDEISTLVNYVADALYCNDRTLTCPGTIEGETLNCGYGTTQSKYGYDSSQANFKMDTYICNGFYDKYMLSNVTFGGNDNETNLNYAMALPTASEIVMAGGSFDDNNSGHFLSSNKSYWTMSPSSFDSSAKVYAVNENGKIVEKVVNSSDVGIRPVISISEDISVNFGDGTKNAPYKLN